MSITAYSIKVLSSQVPYLHEPKRCKLDLIALVHLFQAKIFIKTEVNIFLKTARKWRAIVRCRACRGTRWSRRRTNWTTWRCILRLCLLCCQYSCPAAAYRLGQSWTIDHQDRHQFGHPLWPRPSRWHWWAEILDLFRIRDSCTSGLQSKCRKCRLKNIKTLEQNCLTTPKNPFILVFAQKYQRHTVFRQQNRSFKFIQIGMWRLKIWRDLGIFFVLGKDYSLLPFVF